MNAEKLANVLCDLAVIAEDAEAIRRQIYDGKAINLDHLKRMTELAEKVQRQLDPQFEAWVNASSS